MITIAITMTMIMIMITKEENSSVKLAPSY